MSRFDDVLGAAAKQPPASKQPEITTIPASSSNQTPETPTDTRALEEQFWAQFQPGQSKSVKRLNTEIDETLHQALKERCTKHKITMREAVETMLVWFLAE